MRNFYLLSKKVVVLWCQQLPARLVTLVIFHREIAAKAGVGVNRVDGPAGEKDDALQLFVVEKVVERPQTARLAERVRV